VEQHEREALESELVDDRFDDRLALLSCNDGNQAVHDDIEIDTARASQARYHRSSDIEANRISIRKYLYLVHGAFNENDTRCIDNCKECGDSRWWR